MAEQKKDLTDLFASLAAASESSTSDPFEVTPEAPPETVDSFDSIGEFILDQESDPVVHSQAQQEEGEPQGFLDTPGEAPFPTPSPSIDPSSPPEMDPNPEPLPEISPPQPSPEIDPSPSPQPEISPPTEPAQSAEALPPLPAAFPVSLRIRGEMRVQDKEALLDLLKRENMGIREIDLEPQFANHKILIPRISEYAAVLIVQCLRGSQLLLEISPSDSAPSEDAHPVLSEPLKEHPADSLPILTEPLDSFEGVVLDTLTASDLLSLSDLETSRFQDILDSLQRELRYKAYYKGATAVFHFKTQLLPMNSAFYRVLVSGSAVRAQSLSQTPSAHSHA